MVFGPTLTPLDFAGISQPDAIFGDDLAAWWRGDTGVKSSRSRQFTEATDEYFSASSTAKLQSGGDDWLTVAAWVYLDATTPENNFYCFVGKWNQVANNREFRLDYDALGTLGGTANRFSFAVSDDGVGTDGGVASTISPSAGQWYFVIGWHDPTGNTLNIQIDNGTADSSGHTTGINEGSSNFQIGASHNASGSHDGRLARVGIWKRELTAAEKTWLYNSGSGRRYAELGQAGTDGANLLDAGDTLEPVYYDLEEESGNALDASANGLDLTDNATVTVNGGPDLTDNAAADTEGVTAWVSKEGGSLALEQGDIAKWFTYSATGFNNSRPCLTSDGTGIMRFAGQLVTATQGAVIAIVELTAPIANSVVLSSADEAGTDNYWDFRVQDDGADDAAYVLAVRQKSGGGDTETNVGGDFPLAGGIPYILTAYSDGSETTFQLRGLDQTTQDISSTDNGDWLGDTSGRDNFVLGGLKTTSESLLTAMKVAELLVVDATPTAQQISDFNDYANDRYSLTLGTSATTSALPKFVKQKEVLTPQSWLTALGFDSNINFPGPFDNDAARGALGSLPSSPWSVLYSADHDSTGTAIGRADFENILGTWTDNGAAIYSDVVSGDQNEAPSCVFDDETPRVNVYLHRPTVGSGSQRDFLFTSTDIDEAGSLTEVGQAYADGNGPHNGYGNHEKTGAGAYRAAIFYNGSSGSSHVLTQLITSSDGETFTFSKWCPMNGAQLYTADKTWTIRSTFSWGGQTYMLVDQTEHPRSSNEPEEYGAIALDWSDGRLHGRYFPLITAGAVGSDDVALKNAVIIEINSTLYMIYCSASTAGQDGDRFKVAAANMFESATGSTPFVSLDGSGDPDWAAASNTLVDWDATSEDLPASMEISVVSGGDGSSWSGTYYELVGTTGGSELHLRPTTTINPELYDMLEFTLENVQGKDAGLGFAEVAFRLYDGTDGITLIWNDDSAGEKSGKLYGYDGGVEQFAKELYPWPWMIGGGLIRTQAAKWTMRITDYGANAAFLVDDKLTMYTSISGADFVAVKPTIVLKSTVHIRFTRFTVKYGSTA